MMKIYIKELSIFMINIACICFSNNLFSQNDTIINGNKFNYVSKYDNGQIKDLGNYITKNYKLIKDGLWISYNKDGSLFKQGFYKNGKKQGKWIEQNIYKRSYMKGYYKNGKKNGRWYYENVIYYYKNGKLKSIMTVEYFGYI